MSDILRGHHGKHFIDGRAAAEKLFARFALREDQLARLDVSSRQEKAQRVAKQLQCGHCPPHRSENVTRKKRGPQKPRGKNKRRA